MAAAPVQPPNSADQFAQVFSWFEPHWTAVTSAVGGIMYIIWRASQLSERIDNLRKGQERLADKIDRLYEKIHTEDARSRANERPPYSLDGDT